MRHLFITTSLAQPGRALLFAGLRPRLHPAALTAIVFAHLLLVWALLQSRPLQPTLTLQKTLAVALLADERERPPLASIASPEPLRPALPRQASLPPPEVTVATPLLSPPAAPAQPVTSMVPTLPPTLPPVALAAQPAALPVVALPATPPTPQLPRQVLPGSIRYLRPPALEVPLASRRLGESGTVWLRVVVDTQGLPKAIQLHRSSGFARLDEQALAAMRQARFQPMEEAGQAFEWLVIAPLQFDLD